MFDDLPWEYSDEESFFEAIEQIYQKSLAIDIPIQISGFGFWDMESSELELIPEKEKDRLRHGGIMFSVFSENGGQPIGSIRTRFPLPNIFKIVSILKRRLRKAGKIVGYTENDNPTHILTIPRPTYYDQHWDYGIDATDKEALHIFLKVGATKIKKLAV